MLACKYGSLLHTSLSMYSALDQEIISAQGNESKNAFWVCRMMHYTSGQISNGAL